MSVAVGVADVATAESEVGAACDDACKDGSPSRGKSYSSESLDEETTRRTRLTGGGRAESLSFLSL